MDTTTTSEVDLHRLALRFTDTRLPDARAVAALARSIEHCGQVVPCIAVAEGDVHSPLVLVDGYRRILALRRLGRDTALVDTWHCDIIQALLRVLVHRPDRAFAALEEALLIRELVQQQGLSQHEIARRTGRDVSWVSRRLELVCGLPDPLLGALRRGTLSTWAATRILAPLARANTAHATMLLDALQGAPLSTRALQTWFAHYQGATQAVRARMVEQPQLFLDAVQVRTEQQADAKLRAGPEGQCVVEIRQLQAISHRLRQRLRTLDAATLPESLQQALTGLRAPLAALHADLARYDYDPEPHPRCHPHPASPGPESARDQPCPEAVA